MTIIDARRLRRFLRLAGEQLRGEWVVLGGTVLPLLDIEHRTTVDIDIAALKTSGNDQILVLMDIAVQLGLPIEAINQAGAFFLHRVKGWRQNLIPLHQGTAATIYRPDVTLFVLLKLARFTESDLLDCLEFLRYARRHKEKPDAPRLRRALRKLTHDPRTPNAKQERLEQLMNAI